MLYTLLIGLLAGNAGAQERFEVGLWVDHQDYASPSGGVAWDTTSEKGLESIVDYCLRAGATSLYWRGFGGGLTIHNSRVEEGLYPQLVDKRRTSDPLYFNGGVRYGDCEPDIIATVVQICHRKGLKCLLYWPWEDTHNLQAFLSRYTLENPGLWDVRLDGYAAPGRLSLAFAQVRQYKLSLARELLALGVDGFFIDLRRQSNWSPQFGYVGPALSGYETLAGRGPDPAAEDWLRFRAAYHTQMLEDLRELCRRSGRPVQIIASPPIVTADPMSALAGSFSDWPTWVDRGLIDGLAPGGLPFDTDRPMESLERNMDQVRGLIAGRCKLYWPIRTGYDWGSGLISLSRLLNQPVPLTLAQVLRLAWESGAAGVHDDTFDPGLESPEWMATLREKTTGPYRGVNPAPRPAPAAGPPKAAYVRPPEPVWDQSPKPPALEDTANATRLTHSRDNDTEACVAPDGRWVAFQSDRGGQGTHIWRVAMDGGEPRQLTEGACNDLFPAISPDGKWIAFCSDRQDGRFYHIYVMDASDGQTRQLTEGSATDTLPAFSPDGESIVFTSTRGADLYNRSNTLHRVSLQGGEPVSMGALKYAQMEPGTATEGPMLAFCALDELEGVNYYCCVSPTGDPASRVRLTPPNESCYAPALSPDATVVAYSSPGPDRTCGWDIWVREVFGSRLHRITNSSGNDRSPAWSPDAESLVFESNRDGAYDLYAVDVSGLEAATVSSEGPWGPRTAIVGGMVDGDPDPEHTPLVWSGGPRPALDYQNRSFGVHLGRRRPVSRITIVNALPRGECRIDEAHTQIYYGDTNGPFTRYSGPMNFNIRQSGSAILITLSDLQFEAAVVKVHFPFDDPDYTAVASTVDEALIVPDPTREGRPDGVRVWTTIQGKTRLMQWHQALGQWRGDGHVLKPTDVSRSEQYSGEGARAFLPVSVRGDLDLQCQFRLPDNTTGAGGPVVYLGAQPEGRMCAFRYVNYWGTAVLQTKQPGGPWVEVGYSTGRDLAVGVWHTLQVTARAGKVTVRVDGATIVESRGPMPLNGAIGLGCQVRQVEYRSVRVRAEVVRDAPEWSLADDPTRHVLVCADAGRGGYQAFPGLCRLAGGDLLAVLYAGWSHVSRPEPARSSGGAIALSRSADNGRTWSDAQVVLDTPLDDRDPSVWQCPDGTVYVAAPGCDWAKYAAPYDDWCWAHTVRSTDDGHTWTDPEELRIAQKRCFTLWTEPRRLTDGQWLWPMYRNQGSELVAAMMRSTDGGHTWGKPEPLDATATSTDEPDLCEFPDGTLLCVMRPGAEPHMWQSRSRDGGRTWSKPTPLAIYGHSPCLLHTTTGVTLLAHRDPGTSVHYSTDQGNTWAGAVMIDPCGGAYPQMVELPDGRVLIVYYTEGGRSQIRGQFLRVDASGIDVVAP